jgi:hypothetical protein
MTARKAKPASVRDVLARKVRPSRSYRFLVTDPTEAEQALAHAQHGLRIALLGDDEKAKAAAHKAVEDARDALDGCWHTIRLVSLPAPQFTALLAEHPPTKDQRREGAEWNPDTFHPALIAACAQDEGLTAEQWAAELDSDRWSQGERNELFNLALDVNVSTPRQLGPALRSA